MGHYDEQREQQIALWETYKEKTTGTTTSSLLNELEVVFGDTKENCNLTFRGFLIGNYPLEVLRDNFPVLYEYIIHKNS